MTCYEHYPASDGWGVLDDLKYQYVYASFMYMRDNRFYTHQDYARIFPKKECEYIYCYECPGKEAMVCTYKLYIECKCGLRVKIPRRQLIWVLICY